MALPFSTMMSPLGTFFNFFIIYLFIYRCTFETGSYVVHADLKLKPYCSQGGP